MNRNKILMSVALILIILIGGFLLLNNYIYNEKQGDDHDFKPYQENTEEIVEENEEEIPRDIKNYINSKSDLIQVDSPKPFDEISSPVKVSGMARGTWFFEGDFPITVVDWDGKIIGEGYATAQGEWMTTEFVPFTGTINFNVESDTAYKRGAIIFRKDNPSDRRELDDALEIPVNFE